MSDNPFAAYNIEIPKKYAEDIKKHCQTGGGRVTYEFAPFNRQVDLWYFAFIYAIKNGLEPVIEKDTSNITPAIILSGDSYRIDHIQLAYLAITSIKELANHRKVFDYALSMANAGFPYVLQLLKDPDDKPLWTILDEIEKAA